MEEELVDGIKITYFVKGDAEHQDSFWYDGEIAELEYKGRKIRVLACGEIRIHKKDGELVYDCKERNSGFEGFSLEKDEDLKRIGCNYDDDYYWENNNWFDFLFKREEWEMWEDMLGDVAGEYDEAIEWAIAWLKDDQWWSEYEQRKVMAK